MSVSIIFIGKTKNLPSFLKLITILNDNKLGQHQSQTPFSSAFWVQKDFQYKIYWVQKNVSSDQSWLDLTRPNSTCPN